MTARHQHCKPVVVGADYVRSLPQTGLHQKLQQFRFVCRGHTVEQARAVASRGGEITLVEEAYGAAVHTDISGVISFNVSMAIKAELIY
jgi:hypothetical protein